MNNAFVAGRKHKGTKTAVFAVMAGTLVVLTTACGVTGPENPSPSSSSASATSVAGTSVNGFKTKKELAEDSQGRKFVKTTLGTDDELFTYHPEIRTPAAVMLFTDEEAKAAQKVASFYYADQFTDSILKGDNITQADKDLWWENTKADFDPEQVQVFTAHLGKAYDSQDAVMYQNPDRVANGYAIEYNENDIQIRSRQIDYTEIIAQEIQGEKYIGFKANIYFELPVMKDGEHYLEKVTATGKNALTQISPGVFKISGMDLKVTSVAYDKQIPHTK